MTQTTTHKIQSQHWGAAGTVYRMLVYPVLTHIVAFCLYRKNSVKSWVITYPKICSLTQAHALYRIGVHDFRVIWHDLTTSKSSLQRAKVVQWKKWFRCARRTMHIYIIVRILYTLYYLHIYTHMIGCLYIPPTSTSTPTPTCHFTKNRWTIAMSAEL